MLLPLLLSIASPQAAPDRFCATISTVRLHSGETVQRSRGEDFDVYYVSGPEGEFGVYDGRYAQVSDGVKTKAFVRGSLIVYRVAMDGEFRGYLVANADGEQNHFFGTVFKGDRSDEAFFDRVTFAACERAE